MIGNSLRMGSGESAQFPTEVKDVLAMFAPFTKSDEDPTSLTLVGNEADHIQRQASASMESWPWVNFA
jgi:hypothetical protein